MLTSVLTHMHTHVHTDSSEPYTYTSTRKKNPNSNGRVLTSSGVRSVSRRDCGSHFDICIYTCTHAVLLYTFSLLTVLFGRQPWARGRRLQSLLYLFPIPFQGSLAQVFPVPSTPSPSPELIPFPSPVTLRIPCSFLSPHNVLCLSSGSLPGPSGLSAALLCFNTQGYNCPSCSFSF